MGETPRIASLRLRPSFPCAGARRTDRLILSNIRSGGCLKIEKLYLYKKGPDNTLERTKFFLSGTISRVDEKFYCEFRANFGNQPPNQAKILISENNER